MQALAGQQGWTRTFRCSRDSLSLEIIRAGYPLPVSTGGHPEALKSSEKGLSGPFRPPFDANSTLTQDKFKEFVLAIWSYSLKATRKLVAQLEPIRSGQIPVSILSFKATTRWRCWGLGRIVHRAVVRPQSTPRRSHSSLQRGFQGKKLQILMVSVQIDTLFEKVITCMQETRIWERSVDFFKKVFRLRLQEPTAAANLEGRNAHEVLYCNTVGWGNRLRYIHASFPGFLQKIFRTMGEPSEFLQNEQLETCLKPHEGWILAGPRRALGTVL